MSSSALFHKSGHLSEYLENRKKIVVKNIEDYHPIFLKDMNIEREYEIVLNKYLLEIPKLLVEVISQESREVEIRNSKNILHHTDRRPVYRRGLHLEIVIPFEGESLLFNYRPSTSKGLVPRGKIENNTVILEYEITDEARKNFSYSNDLEYLQEYLSFVELDVNGFNTWLENNVSNLLIRRKSQSEERNKFVNGLNIPARARAKVDIRPLPHYSPEERGHVRVNNNYKFDAFICHASEDKIEFVTPLANELTRESVKVWYDEFSLKLGDSLRDKIDEGLRDSRYGIVILSKAFFLKDWPKKELDGLISKEVDGKKVILPIWHDVSSDDVASYSPILVGRVASKSSEGLSVVVSDILDVIFG